MKKNQKGFTLVEILAAIVIVGVLSAISIPAITGMIEKNRNKIYISDAQKMISKVEYLMKSTKDDIEKPEDGDCVVVGLAYIDSSEFDNPPNNGTYSRAASFVVVKNNGTSLEYSSMLVEELKDGSYKGIQLTTNDELIKNSAVTHVELLSDSTLANVETVSSSYINNYLGTNYVSSVKHVYTKNEQSSNYDDTYIDQTVPVITKATLSSTSGKNYNSLDATLTIRVEDEDTPTSDISIYLSMISYDDALSSTPLNYGNLESFSKQYNFDNSYDGSTVNLYIVVKDPEGNEDRKKIIYAIHNDSNPSIDEGKSNLTRLDSDSYNLPTAKLTLFVSDDVDSLSNLMVCFAEDRNATSCGSYQSYTSVFGNENSIPYTFSGKNICSNGGETLYLKVFVKDTSGLISSKVFSYQLYNNANPTVSDVVIQSDIEGGLQTKIQVDASDELTSDSGMSLVLSDGVQTVNVSSYDRTALIPFTFSGTNDGSTRTLTVTARDECGASSSKAVYYTVYRNDPPTITNASVQSYGTACNNADFCPVSSGGNYKTTVSFNASDDIDDDVSICVSETLSDCDSSNLSNFKSYVDNYNVPFEFNFAVSCVQNYNCDNQDRTLYIVALDSQGGRTEKALPYKIYKNTAPAIHYLNISSNPSGSKNVNISFEIDSDDFNSFSELSYLFTDGTNNVSGQFDNENGGYVSFDYEVSGQYDGTTKDLTLTITDGYGVTSTKTEEYQLYDNQGPTINDVTVTSDTAECYNYSTCPFDSTHNYYKANLRLDISDDLDGDNFKVCVSENASDCDVSNTSNYTDYSNYKNQDVSFTFSHTATPFDGSTRTLYIYAMDTLSEVSVREVSYTLYQNLAPSVVGEVSVESTMSDAQIHSSQAKFISFASDDLDFNLQEKVCYTLDGSTEEVCLSDYTDYFQSKDIDFGVTDYTGQKYHVYAYVKDSYGEVVKTDSVVYQLHDDTEPSILNVSAVVNASGYNNMIVISANVEDYFDTYQVCIDRLVIRTPEVIDLEEIPCEFQGEDNTCVSGNYEYSKDEENDKYYRLDISPQTCSSSYSTESFNGTIKKSNIFTVNTTDFGDYSNGISFFVRDSHGNVVTSSTTVSDYSECSIVDAFDSHYDFTLDTSKGSSNQEISAQRCSGKCYSYQSYLDENGNLVNNGGVNIIAYYKQRISYRDIANNTKYCVDSNTEVDYEATCGFISCFYNTKGNNYTNLAIGLTEIQTTPYIEVVDGTSYQCNSYYKVYNTSYDPSQDKVTLTETNNRVCSLLIDNDIYKYDSNADVPYIRVQD